MIFRLVEANLTELSGLILGGVFVFASLYKITNPNEFAKTIKGYHIVPTEIVLLCAIIIAWTEFLFGIFLFIGYKSKISATVLLFLLIFFIGITIVSLVRGINPDCGCFSYKNSNSQAVNSPLKTIIRDLFLIIPGLIILQRKDSGREK